MRNNLIDLNAPLAGYMVVTVKNGLPFIEIRRGTSNNELVKSLIFCALHNKPVLMQPTFTDNARALGALIEKGILHKEGENYYFLI